MADTSKDELLLGGGICHITATVHHSSCAEVNKFLLAYVILFKHVYFRQYFACLCERMFNCCNVLLSQVKVPDRIAVVISEIIGRTGRHFSAHFLW